METLRRPQCTASCALRRDAPVRRAAAPFADGEPSQAHEERPGSFAERSETKPRDGFRATVDMAAGGGRGPE
jgi:hypothetical protein